MYVYAFVRIFCTYIRTYSRFFCDCLCNNYVVVCISHIETSMSLTEDLTSLSQWIFASRMQVNIYKFRLMQVDHYKYVFYIFDPQLKWDIQLNHVYKQMSYYLYLISYHHRKLCTITYS